ncbi:MAG: hypothetical protein C4305_02960 [Thermoleophilia bacterium]
MPSRDQARGAMEAVDRVLNRGGDADEVLRAVVDILARLYSYAAIAFVEGDELVLGPAQGAPQGDAAAIPVVFQGAKVAELHVSPVAAERDERSFLERVATLISAHCLVGWDTGGVPWDAVE